MDVYDGHSNDDENTIDISLAIFRGHKGEVNSCTLSPDYQLLVTAADDSRLIIWNVLKRSKLCELIGHQGPVNSCVFSSNNKLVASGSHDSTVRLWETSTSECLKVLSGHSRSVEKVCFSPDDATLCSASWDKTLNIWDVKSGVILHCLVGHSDCVKSCVFSSCGTFIASGGWDFLVKVWKLKPTLKDTSEESKWMLRRYEKAPGCDVYVISMKGHTGNVSTVAFSIAGLLASGSWDRTVCLWDPFRGNLLKKLTGHSGWIKAVNFSINSIELASTADDDTVRVWNVISGECTKIYPALTDISQTCHFSSSGSLIASGSAPQ
ncbi:unnamed protein product [Clavelina lepadiformis]|uniref:WD repeat-containing protein 38 n=1 Tax=Clavelina lepadiformis TaxID=159417 RepID=A0ABP0FZ96_CLALP